jgi:hypothetical protein
MARYSAHYDSDSSSIASSISVKPPKTNWQNKPFSIRKSANLYTRHRYHRIMSSIKSTSAHAQWEAVILSPQFAVHLDDFFEESRDYHSKLLIDQVRTAELIAADMTLLSTKLPDVVPNLIHVHRKMKALSFALLDPTTMESAVTYAFQKVEDLPELESNDGSIKMIRNRIPTPNYSYSPGWEEDTPAPTNEIPQRPPSSELEYVDTYTPIMLRLGWVKT